MRHARRRTVLTATLAVALVTWLDRATPPVLDEALPLRWLRAVSDHPLRSWIALSVLLWPLPGAPATSSESGVQDGGGSALQ